jgi:hypothetical protein
VSTMSEMSDRWAHRMGSGGKQPAICWLFYVQVLFFGTPALVHISANQIRWPPNSVCVYVLS